MCQRVAEYRCHRCWWRSFGVTWSCTAKGLKDSSFIEAAGPSRTTCSAGRCGSQHGRRSFPDERTYRPMTLANPNSHDSGDTTSVTPPAHGGFARASTPSSASVGRVIGRSRCSSTFTRASLPVGRTRAWSDSYGASRDYRRRRRSNGRSPPPLSYCGPAAQGERCGCHRSSSPSQIWYQSRRTRMSPLCRRMHRGN